MTYSDPSFGVWNDATNPAFTVPPYDPLCYLTLAENGYLTRTTTQTGKFLKYPLPNSYSGATSVRTTLGAGALITGRRYDHSLGLYQIDNQDYTSSVPQTRASANAYGRSARTAQAAGAARKMYFAVEHNWNYQMGGTTHIGVLCLYYDKGFNGSTDKLSLVYDGQSGTTTHATTYTLGNTGVWKEVVWNITDAYFGGRLLTLNGSTFGDFYFTHPDSSDLWISEAAVTGSSNTTNTYYFLVAANNTSNVQSQLTSKTLNQDYVQGASQISAVDIFTP